MNYPLKSLFLHITQRCNMKCKHCWVSSDTPTASAELGYQQFEGAVLGSKELGLEGIKITGGEPLLRFDLVCELIQLASQLKLHVSLESNGTLLNQEEAKIMKRCGIDEIGISLDFPDELRFERFRGLEGSYKKVLRAMELASTHGITCGCIITVLKSNLDELGDIAELVFSLGVNAIKLSTLIKVRRGKELKEEHLTPDDYIKFTKNVIHLYDRWPERVYATVPPFLLGAFGLKYLNMTCGSCSYKNLLTILSNGDISLCGIGITHPELIVGNIRERSIKEIWANGSGCLNELRELTPAKFKGICGKCVFKSFCGGVCPADSYEAYGDFSAAYPDCEALYEAGLLPCKYLIG